MGAGWHGRHGIARSTPLRSFVVGCATSTDQTKRGIRTRPACPSAVRSTTHCQAPTQLAHGLAPRLRRRGRGGVLFTSSVEGLVGCPYSAGYSATKAYVNALGEALWAELAPAGVDVLTLCPGATDTEAPRLQGVDPTTLQDLMSPDDVARSALKHLREGPTHIPSAHYRQVFDTLLAMPRRDALTAMARSMGE
ncbi:SDR family NAD(P)-dependent oxidoreductase [Streptomyces sp. NPDC050509]|uniref:SDR family NAD(P)-dependent oxidoreductase n=1 Tax=Streptomyces sp. NPDC050509 TaxID=3365620 RepID=UPI0037A63967